MAILKKTRNPFTKISELLEHKYNPRQLCHYWRNYLDPELCLDPLDDNDKQFIDKWILNNRIGEGEIKWQTLRHDLRKKTGRFRSENDVKNYWYSKQRRLQGTPGVSDSDKVKRRQGTLRGSVKRRQGTPRVYDSDKVKKRLGTTGVSKMKGRQRATEVSDKMRIYNLLNQELDDEITSSLENVTYPFP